MKLIPQRRRHLSQSGFSLIELLIVVAIMGILAAIAVPYLTAAKQAARSASAISTLRVIHASEASHRAIVGVYGSLANLKNAGFIHDQGIADGLKHLYTFTAVPGADATMSYTANADPTFKPETYHHYFVNETGVIRDEIGAPATSASVVLDK